MSRARDLRRSAGLAERRLWARLRGGAVDGFKIRRQHEIGPYFADFACVDLRLVIEIDGGVHGTDEAALRDHHRQMELEALGWTVVRFPNDITLGEPWRIDDATQTITLHLFAPLIRKGFRVSRAAEPAVGPGAPIMRGWRRHIH